MKTRHLSPPTVLPRHLGHSALTPTEASLGTGEETKRIPLCGGVGATVMMA